MSIEELLSGVNKLDPDTKSPILNSTDKNPKKFRILQKAYATKYRTLGLSILTTNARKLNIQIARTK